MAPNPWKDEATVAVLKALWLEGLSASQIAARLGLESRSAVLGKIHRMGFSGRTATSPLKKRPAVKEVRRTNPNATTVDNRRINAKLRAEAARSALEAYAQRHSEDTARKSLLDLDEQDCRFVVGEPSGSLPCFCALPQMTGSAYCATHFLRTHEAPSPRARTAVVSPPAEVNEPVVA